MSINAENGRSEAEGPFQICNSENSIFSHLGSLYVHRSGINFHFKPVASRYETWSINSGPDSRKEVTFHVPLLNRSAASKASAAAKCRAVETGDTFDEVCD